MFFPTAPLLKKEKERGKEEKKQEKLVSQDKNCLINGGEMEEEEEESKMKQVPQTQPLTMSLYVDWCSASSLAKDD